MIAPGTPASGNRFPISRSCKGAFVLATHWHGMGGVRAHDQNPYAMPAAIAFQGYSPAELAEFGVIITAKLTRAQEVLNAARESLLLGAGNGTSDTDFAPHELSDGAPSLEREDLMRIIAREEKFILELQHALARMRGGTYGICRVTGQLIPKDRLRAVPHTTLSMDAKREQQPLGH